MSRKWKPGELAMIETICIPGQGEFAAVADEKGWSSLDPSIGWVMRSDVMSARPLVMIDPEALIGRSLLPGWLRWAARDLGRDSTGPIIDDLNALADVIEAAYDQSPATPKAATS